MMQRRPFIKAVIKSAALVTASSPAVASAGLFGAARAETSDAPQPFDYAWLKGEALTLSSTPYQSHTGEIPDILASLDYDSYQSIQFRHDHSLWADEGLAFQIRFFHLGRGFKDPVRMYEVVDGKAQHIAYDPRMFDFKKTGIKPERLSRDLDFAQGILEATNDEGIDVVIGAQTGQAMHASLNILRMGGRYIEVGKKDIAEDNSLPLRAFNRNLIFASVDIDRLAEERPQVIQRTLGKVLEHLAKGDFKLGETRTFAARDIQQAFEEMTRSRHIGKQLVDFSGGTVEVRQKPERPPVVKSDGCYIVTGGTSGFGLATGRWLAEQGAGRILLVSRSGGKAPGLADEIEAMEAKGAKVEAVSVDVSDAAAVAALVQSAQAAPFVLRGILHGAMVLDDAMMADLTDERFRKVFVPKVAGALHLAEAVKGVSSLDFLVFYSSISSVIGNRGQTNYVAANSLLDALAHGLRARGVPALSINWGALAEAGVVARDEKLEAILRSEGVTGLKNREAFEVLKEAIQGGRPQVGAFIVDWEAWHNAHPDLSDDPRFAALKTQAGTGGGNDAASQIKAELAELSKEQRLGALEGHLQDVLANTLKMPKDNISVSRKLNEMGVDSLMVLELSLGIKERIGVSFSAMEFLKGPNLQQLAAMAETRLWST